MVKNARITLLLFVKNLIFTLFFLSFAGVAYGKVLYVTMSGANNKSGTSWDNASDDLQAMINISNWGDQIWVAAGTYKPKYTADDWMMGNYPNIDGQRDNAFVLKAGVAIYGGFIGGETNFDARDWEINKTILSGDFNGDDGADFTNMDENAYHVVIGVVQNSVLDGFVITGGNADGYYSNITVAGLSVHRRYGGGIVTSINSSLSLTNVIVSKNKALDSGGGIYHNNDRFSVLTNVTVSENKATSSGGGIYNNSSSTQLHNVTISKNQANAGGGIYNSGSSPQLTDVTISENRDGIYNINNSEPVLNRVRINNNITYGMYNYSSSPILNDVTISGNQGSGMLNFSASSPVLTNVTISNNQSSGMYNENSAPELNNVTISGNQTSNYAGGGGMYNYDSSPILTDVFITDNQSDGCGGGMYNTNNSAPKLRNVIIRNNRVTGTCSGGGMYNENSSPELNDVLIEKNQASSGAGMHNTFSSSPKLTNVTISENSGNMGSGIYNDNSSPELNGVLISKNQANGSGGGIYNDFSPAILTNVIISENRSGDSGGGIYNSNDNNDSFLILINVIISKNDAGSSGGGMLNHYSLAQLTNVLISENYAPSYGGGMYNTNSSPLLTNVTVSGNQSNYAQGIYNSDNSSPKLINSIIWGNGSNDIDNYISDPFYSHCIVPGSGGSGSGNWENIGTDDGNNIDIDPMLDSDYGLSSGSPAIDAGSTPANLITTDLDGNARVIGGIIDMGAYEYVKCGKFKDLKILFSGRDTLCYGTEMIPGSPYYDTFYIAPGTVPKGGEQPYQYIWQTYTTNGWTDYQGDINTHEPMSNFNESSSFDTMFMVRLIVKDASNECEVISDTVIIRGLPYVPELPSYMPPFEVYSGEMVSSRVLEMLSLINTNPATRLKWEADDNYAAVGLPYKSGIDSIPGFTATITDVPIETQILIMPTIEDCLAFLGRYTSIIVNPIPAADPGPTLNNLPSSPEICSGTTFFYHPESATNPEIRWSRADVVCISEEEKTDQTGDINEPLTNETTTPIDVTYTFILTENGKTNTQTLTVKVNPKPAIDAISGENNVCKNSSIILSNSTQNGLWKSANTAIATVTSDGTVTGVSTGDVNIWYVFTDAVTGCSDSVSKKIKVAEDKDYNYPDICLRACPFGTFNLSKYVDTAGVRQISWTSSNVSINSDGVLNASQLVNHAVYTFKYTVIAGCDNTPITRKVYLKTLGNNESLRWRDTIAICYKHAETMNINQLFGIEAGAAPVASIPSKYITQTSYGGTIFNGKLFYEDNHDVNNVAEVEFSCTLLSGSCQSGKEYKLVIVLTQDLTE